MEYYITAEPGVNVYISDINTEAKKVILFIHGWPLSGRAYEYQINELPKLGYRCITMDTRGFGNSDKPWDGYGYDRLADDVFAVVQALGLKGFTLCGHSMGGATAVRYMGRHGGYGVSKLALFGAAVPSLTRRPDFPYGLPKEDVTRLIDMAKNDRPKMLRTFNEMFFFQYQTDPLENWFFDLGLQAAGWATIDCAVTFRDEELFSDMGKIRIPTVIMHGIHDKVCLYELAIAMNRGIAGSKLVPFENSGHGLFYEQRDKLNSDLAEFIG